MSALNLKPNPECVRVRRKSAARMLSCGVSTLKRREAAGLLTPIRDVERGAVYYSLDQVAALAGRKVEGGQP
jgi:hypothetical protein